MAISNISSSLNVQAFVNVLQFDKILFLMLLLLWIAGILLLLILFLFRDGPDIRLSSCLRIWYSAGNHM